MNTKNIITLLTLTSSLLFLSSCEDKINLKLDEGQSQLVVDAFLTNQRIPQVVKLTKTSSYFDNSPSPAAKGATVTVTDNTTKQLFVFNDMNNDGNYTWTPAPGDTLTKAGHTYSLSVTYSGDVFTATSKFNPVPSIDSIGYEYQEAGGMVQKSGFYAQFYALDIAGRKDYYWIKAFTNDVFDNDPNSINIAEDAAFGGDGADGFMFIIPIRAGITRGDKPFQKGNKLRVELHAINQQAYDFLTEVRTQSQNGGLFAVPVANIVSSINNANPNVAALGCFNISSVSEKQIEIK